jgi:peptidyl-prolyl cis-trans isomerase C
MSLTNTPNISVNGRDISAANIDSEVQYHPAATRREAMVKAAQALIIKELVIQKALQEGLLEPSQLSDSEQEYALIDQLIEKNAPPPKATEQECKRYYQANLDRFTTPPLVEAKHVLLVADPSDLELRGQSKLLAEQLIEELQSGADFAELAAKHSMCPSKEVGGSLGQLSSGQTVPEFQRQIFAAGLGLMPGPIESRFGFHVVYIERKVEGKQLPYNMVEAKINQYLNDKVHRKAIAQYIQHLIQEADIKGFSFNSDSSPLMQ